MPMKSVLAILISLLFVAPLPAQIMDDSLVVDASFNPTETVMPLTLVGVGALGFVNPLKSARYEVSDCVEAWRGNHRCDVESYLKFVPVASVYGLSLLGAEAKHSYLDRTLSSGIAFAVVYSITHGAKFLIHSPRPNGLSDDSFPSGHTAFSFMGAELVRIEYGDDSPWYTAGAYAVATAVGMMRIYNGHHWFTDVVAGAGVGMLSARVGYWLLPYTRRMMHKITGWDVFIYPSVGYEGASLGFAMRF